MIQATWPPDRFRSSADPWFGSGGSCHLCMANQWAVAALLCDIRDCPALAKIQRPTYSRADLFAC